MRACGHEVTPYVVTSDILVRLLHEFLIGEYHKWIRAAPEPRGKQSEGPHSSVRLGSQIHHRKHEIALETLLTGAHFVDALQGSADQTELANCGGFAREIATTMIGMLAWMTDLRRWALRPRPAQDHQDTLTFARSAFHSFAAYMYANHEEAREDMIGTVESVIDSAAGYRALRADPLMESFWELLDLSRSRRCAAPTCTITFAGAGRKFKFCSGCGRMPYCSAVCQRAGWCHADLPHRDICGAIAALNESTGLPRRLSEDNVWDLDDTTERYSEEVRLASMIKHHIHAVHAAKLELLSALGKPFTFTLAADLLYL
jgi:hypothetical protein